MPVLEHFLVQSEHHLGKHKIKMLVKEFIFHYLSLGICWKVPGYGSRAHSLSLDISWFGWNKIYHLQTKI